MSGNTKQLKTKIAAVNNLQKITKAMEMVARSKMKRAVDAALATRAYARLALELLVNISGEKLSNVPFLSPNRNTERTLLIYIASDKGLCGGYNASLRKKLAQYLADKDLTDQDFIAIGKYAKQHLAKFEGNIIKELLPVPDKPIFADLDQINNFILEQFATGHYQKVELIYTNYVSMFSRPVIHQDLLPVNAENIKQMIANAGGTENEVTVTDLDLPKRNQYLFEPGEEEVLSVIIPELVRVNLYQALLESLASEHSARMMAMKNATDNGEKLGSELDLRYNRARQAGITTEILEIAAGAEALN